MITAPTFLKWRLFYMTKKGGREHENIMHERRWRYAENVEEGKAGVGLHFESQYREEELQSAVPKVLEGLQAELSDGDIGVSKIRG